VLAVAAVTRVADTREGLVAEIVTLFAGGAAVGLLIYAFVARPDFRPRPAAPPPARATDGRPTRRDLGVGVGGLVLAVVLLAGLSVSGGALWAGLGFALLLPMIAGSVYLCVRFLRSSP
jgi:hypothetical protein